jgi:hypothetical protein
MAAYSDRGRASPFLSSSPAEIRPNPADANASVSWRRPLRTGDAKTGLRRRSCVPEAERLRLTDEERAVLRIMERDLRRPLTEQEEHLALEQVRALGMA